MNKIKIKSKLITFFLLVIFIFLFSGLEFIHNHSEFQKNDNCQICSFFHTLSGTDINFKSSFFKNDTFEIFNLKPTFLFLSDHPFSLNLVRAPPFS